MSWLAAIVLGATGIAAMRAAFERGDVDEAARQGALAGPAVLERILRAPDRPERTGSSTPQRSPSADPTSKPPPAPATSKPPPAPAAADAGGGSLRAAPSELPGKLPRSDGAGANLGSALPIDRMTKLAAIAAAPIVEDRAELLAVLAEVAGGPDRRMAIPAAGAARAIARELARRGRPDDLAPDDIATWRATWAGLALRTDRWIELRLIALDTAAALDPAGLGVDPATALGDRDPAFRRAAATIVPLPAPRTSYRALATAVVEEPEPDIALAAGQSLCTAIDATNQRAVLDALGAAGLARLRTFVAAPGLDPGAVRIAARCLAADRSPESAAALRALGPARAR